MRKLILMAVAGYLWKKFTASRAVTGSQVPVAGSDGYRSRSSS